MLTVRVKQDRVQIQQMSVSQQFLNTMYTEAKNDYRTSLKMEQSILSLVAALLTIATAAGFTLFGKKESWIIFAIVNPFCLSLVNVLFLHQKHRSRTYKVFIFELEKEIPTPLKFETWKSSSISKFVSGRVGFYFCLLFILLMISPLFIIIAFLSFPSAKDEVLLLKILNFIIALIVISDLVCIFYVFSIHKLNRKMKTKKVKKKSK